eukprot:jgi/Mesvir1/22631/Mv25458-RA.1
MKVTGGLQVLSVQQCHNALHNLTATAALAHAVSSITPGQPTPAITAMPATETESQRTKVIEPSAPTAEPTAATRTRAGAAPKAAATTAAGSKGAGSKAAPAPKAAASTATRQKRKVAPSADKENIPPTSNCQAKGVSRAAKGRVAVVSVDDDEDWIGHGADMMITDTDDETMLAHQEAQRLATRQSVQRASDNKLQQYTKELGNAAGERRKMEEERRKMEEERRKLEQERRKLEEEVAQLRKRGEESQQPQSLSWQQPQSLPSQQPQSLPSHQPQSLPSQQPQSLPSLPWPLLQRQQPLPPPPSPQPSQTSQPILQQLLDMLESQPHLQPVPSPPPPPPPQQPQPQLQPQTRLQFLHQMWHLVEQQPREQQQQFLQQMLQPVQPQLQRNYGLLGIGMGDTSAVRSMSDRGVLNHSGMAADHGVQLAMHRLADTMDRFACLLVPNSRTESHGALPLSAYHGNASAGRGLPYQLNGSIYGQPSGCHMQ